MITIMNSAVMPAGNFGAYRYTPATLDDLAAVLRGDKGEWKSSIGYPQNAELIRAWTGLECPVNRVEAAFNPGDMAFVMRLKGRVDPATKGASVSESPENWEFAWVHFEG